MLCLLRCYRQLIEAQKNFKKEVVRFGLQKMKFLHKINDMVNGDDADDRLGLGCFGYRQRGDIVFVHDCQRIGQ